jgi:hypothetical protein
MPAVQLMLPSMVVVFPNLPAFALELVDRGYFLGDDDALERREPVIVVAPAGVAYPKVTIIGILSGDYRSLRSSCIH